MIISYMKDRRLTASALKDGHVVIYPTDTIYGMGSLWSSGSNARIYSIKKRDKAKPLIILSNLLWAHKFAYCNDKVIGEFWPGEYTLILKAKRRLPWWISDGKTVAIRVPSDKLLRNLLMMTGEPITSTSVNISGNLPMNNPILIAEEFENKVDLIAQYSDFVPKKASKIVDIYGNTDGDNLKHYLRS